MNPDRIPLDDIPVRAAALTGAIGAQLIPACPACLAWTARARGRACVIGDRICPTCGSRSTIRWEGEAGMERWSVHAAAPGAREVRA